MRTTSFKWAASAPVRPLKAIILSSLLAAGSVFAAPAVHSPRVAPKPASDARPAEELFLPEPTAHTDYTPARIVDSAPVKGLANGTADRSQTAGGRFALTSAQGMVFHRTDQPVRALRTVFVPGSATQLYTWQEEQADGSLQAFYAYAQGGLLPLGRARETSYEVELQNVHFDPLVKAYSPTVSALAADDRNTLHLVQFLASPLPEFRSAIEAAGGKVLRFMTQHTYLVEMDPKARAAVGALPYVRWIGAYHPEYRLEDALQASLVGRAARLPAQRYSIMLGERSGKRQEDVASQVRQLGGKVELVEAGGLRVEATLSQDQLAQLVRSNDVQFIDRWGGPGELDMNIVRDVGGANNLETVKGWTGQGVRGEVFDTELNLSHQEWPTAPIVHSTGLTTGGTFHGTSVYSINFARGTSANARGMLPSGQGIFFRYDQSSQFGGPKSRYDINKELIDPAGAYRAVFQTSSVGSALVTTYTTISAEVDDYLFQYPILSTQSQSNAGSTQSRPQAWAKNIVSIGGVYHQDTATRTDDSWSFGGSTGPAADGRIKPDLSFFYDQIYSATGTGNANYTQFGGTSAATPETSGHFGLLFQMWHNGVWTNFGGKADVFTSRPQMATAKALMINNAWRYTWTAGGSNADITRVRQGWGTSDLKELLDRASVTSIIDESDVVTPFGVKGYNVVVAPGQTKLNVTMVYTDPMGTVGAARARINDLSLRVTSPSGVVYWGNNGLSAGNLSTSGGLSNVLDTVENVFLANPAAGTWRVDIFGDEIVQDAHLETPEIDADYGLVVNGGIIQPNDPELGQPAFTGTFSAPSGTRGYFFTAPTDFVITALQVPNEAGAALQNVQVVRFDPGVVPPAFSSFTNAFTSLHRAVLVPAGQVIRVKIPVYAGDVIGILGGTGDASVTNSSYGTGPFNTSIYGSATTLARLGMQYNLTTTPAKELWTEAGGSIARVRMFYAPNQQAPLPAFGSTFSSAALTRGFWFTAPADFIISGLQVPNEAGAALQHVQLVKFNGNVPPTTWPTTTNAFTTLLRSVNQPVNSVIRTSIPVLRGEVIGVLGATGDATIMNSSYGTGPFASSIEGRAVSLTRLGMQFNLVSTSAQDLWTEVSSIGRVKLFYVRYGATLLPKGTAAEPLPNDTQASLK